MTKERNSELEEISIEISKTDVQREKRMEKMEHNTFTQGNNSKSIFLLIMFAKAIEMTLHSCTTEN